MLYALDISHNELGNKGCERLSDALVELVRSSDVHLQNLIMSHCAIGDSGIFALANLLKLLTIELFALDISQNDFSIHQGANQVALNLQHCVNLHEICLDLKLKAFTSGKNTFFVKSLTNVLRNAERLHKLLISHLLIDSPEEEIILSVLKSRKHLRVLEVSNCSFRASLELGSMIQKSIQSLNLINNAYTHSDFMLLCDSFGSCKLLKSLNLGGTRILGGKRWTWMYLKLSSRLCI